MRTFPRAFARGCAPTMRAVGVPAVAAVVSLVLLVTVAIPAAADPAAEQFKRDIEQLRRQQADVAAEAERLRAEQQAVRAEQQKIQGELQEATERLAALEAELAQLRDQAAATEREVATLTEQQQHQQEQLGLRMRALYTTGSVDPLLMLLSGVSPDTAITTAHYVSALSFSDQAAIEELAATTTRLHRRQDDLARDQKRVAELQAEVEEAREQLNQRLEEAVAVEERLVALEQQAQAYLARLKQQETKRREEERARLAEIERKRREEAARKAREEAARKAREAAARKAREEAARKEAARNRGGGSKASRSSGAATMAVSSGAMVCPQAAPRSFSNDWQAPRSGGRRHQGTDIFGRRGGDVYAITSGTIQFTKVGATAGLFLSLRGDDGHTYWYMHLSSFKVRPGQRVSAGQRIATNGDTGNAKGTPPHVHFEYHPGGGGPTNPYPLLRSIC